MRISWPNCSVHDSSMKSSLTIALVFIALSLNAQEYFQQEVDYVISVTLNDTEHSLRGNIQITYTNNSPDALNEMYFHLWPNAYSSRNTGLGKQKRERGDFDLEFSEASDRGRIDSIAFSVDGVLVNHLLYDGQVDVVRFDLPSPLAAGASIEISTPFHVKIPSADFSRLGHVGQSYQITQWYPKPAVFDRDGWHPMSYLNQGEFYSEFGNFDVSIALPQNYLIGATGELQTKSERSFLLEKAEFTESKPWKEKENDFPESSAEFKTLRYTQNNIHDFAWFADKRFNVIHQEFALESGKQVDGWVFFTNAHAEAWAGSMEYLVDGTRHYSKYVGDYPYSQVSVVDGTLAAGGGMEYPMVTVINGTSNKKGLERVIVHEIGHNWFYGILGSNERENPWMDEGVNSYYEDRFFKEKYPRGESNFIKLLSGEGDGMQELAYRYTACRHQDQTLSISSDDYSSVNYGAMVYSKGAMVMGHLNSVLGNDGFDEAMHSYFKNWRFKHPAPSDMRRSLEESTGQDLSWMFDGLIKSNMKVDHKIGQYKKEEGSVVVSSRTSFSGPIAVGFYQDSSLVDLQVGKGTQFLVASDRGFDKVMIDPERKSSQLTRRNDILNTQGLKKNWQIPAFKPIIGSGLSDRTTIYYSPAIAWNEQDKWMFGAYLSNTELLFKDFEWTFIPLYSFQSDNLMGMASARKTFWFKEESPDRLDVGLKSRRFSFIHQSSSQAAESSGVYYTKLEPRISYSYRHPSGKRGEHQVGLEHHYIETRAFSDSKNRFLDDMNFTELGYGYVKNHGLERKSIQGVIEHHETYQKLTAEAKIERVYDAMKNCWRLRVYGGKMWFQEFIPLGARLSLNGQDGGVSSTGSIDDYRFEHLLFERAVPPGEVPQQIVRNRGGFVQSSRLGYSDDWVAALNAEADLPLPLPVSVYANMGFLDGGDSGTRDFYEGGLRLNIIRNIFDVSFPVLQSSEIKEDLKRNDIKYKETIRFQLRLDQITFRNIIDNLSF